MSAFVALHGALTQPEVMLGLGRACGREVIAPGLPAHPGGPAWDATMDYHTQATQAALRALPEGPVDLMGHSLGGTIALRLAVEHPERIRSLTLFEPVLFAAAPDAARAHHFDVEMADFRTAIEAGEQATAARVFHRYWGTGQRWDDMPAPVRRAITRLIPIIPATQNAISDDAFGLVPQLRHLRMPTLVLTASQAAPVTVAIKTGLVDRIPGAQAAVLQGRGGHMMPVVDPVPVAEAMTAFWSQRAA